MATTVAEATEAVVVAVDAAVVVVAVSLVEASNRETMSRLTRIPRRDGMDS